MSLNTILRHRLVKDWATNWSGIGLTQTHTKCTRTRHQTLPRFCASSSSFFLLSLGPSCCPLLALILQRRTSVYLLIFCSTALIFSSHTVLRSSTCARICFADMVLRSHCFSCARNSEASPFQSHPSGWYLHVVMRCRHFCSTCAVSLPNSTVMVHPSLVHGTGNAANTISANRLRVGRDRDRLTLQTAHVAETPSKMRCRHSAQNMWPFEH
jgi:hypothetical protein